MWGTFWRTLGRRISLIFMVADLLLPAYGWEQLCAIHIGLLNASKLPTKRRELLAQYRTHKRLKRIDHAALGRSPDRADLDDLHIFRCKTIAILASGLEINYENPPRNCG